MAHVRFSGGDETAEGVLSVSQPHLWLDHDLEIPSLLRKLALYAARAAPMLLVLILMSRVTVLAHRSLQRQQGGLSH